MVSTCINEEDQKSCPLTCSGLIVNSYEKTPFSQSTRKEFWDTVKHNYLKFKQVKLFNEWWMDEGGKIEDNYGIH